MTSLLHISDPHFGTERAEVVAALRTLATQLNPQVVVLSGDITQRARKAQFRRARDFVDDLAVARWLVIPGNHDIPLFDFVTRLLNPYREYRLAFGKILEPELDTQDLLVLCVNTTRPGRHKNGEVSDAQIERVATRLLAASAEQLRVIVVHQPVAVMRVEDEPDRLRRADQAVRRWSDAGADLVLGGHIHLPYVLALHEQMRGLRRRMWAVQAGTAVSNRVRVEADNSINFVRYLFVNNERRAEVERWDWRSAAGRFELVRVDTLALSREGRF